MLVGFGNPHFERLRERVRVAPRRMGLFEAMETIAKEHADYLEDEDLPRLIPVWREEPELGRRRSKVMHAEVPLLLAEDFATREGSSTPSPCMFLPHGCSWPFWTRASPRRWPRVALAIAGR